MSAVESKEPGAWQEDLDVSVYAESSVTLPGKGDRGDGCGEWGFREFCEACGELHSGPHRCHQRGCPDCFSAWLGKRTEAIVRRLQAARWSQPDGLDRRVVHSVASPPEGEVRTISDVRRYRRKARERMQERGFRGGVCIFHGFRVKDEVKAEFRDLEDFEGGVWRYIRENDRMWRSQVYWSPHFHFLGLCREFEADSNDDEWVVRRLSSMDPFSKLTDRDAYLSVAKTAMYLLTHATFESEGSVKAVTWGGDVHPSNFQPDPMEGEPDGAALPCLSAGALKVIERLSAEVCKKTEEAGESGPGEQETCDQPDCTGRLLSIFEAGDYLMDPTWCEQVGRDQQRRVTVAFEWRIGDIVPPPGLQRPTSEDQLWEAFEVLVDQREGY